MFHWVVLQDSGSVIGIDLNEDIACTSERAFERLSNLQFLRIFSKGVNPQSMNYISQKLRLLVWQGSEMTCFPSNFNPKFLVKLQMQDTKFEKLWEGIKVSNILFLKITAQVRLSNQFFSCV